MVSADKKIQITQYLGRESKVEIPGKIYDEEVTEIQAGAFKGKEDLVEVFIPASVTHIGNDAFQGCKKLSRILLPDGVKIIGNRAFKDCLALTRFVVPERVTSLGAEAFKSCANLSEVTLGRGLTEIRDGTFSLCTSLAQITIPEGVASIGIGAFSGCTRLAHVILGPRVVDLGMMAFASCPITSLTASPAMIQKLTLPNPSGLRIHPKAAGAPPAPEEGASRVLARGQVWTLYRASQTQATAEGEAAFDLPPGGDLALDYEIEQSEDLVHWTPYSGSATPLLRLPTNQAFVRIKAKK